MKKILLFCMLSTAFVIAQAQTALTALDNSPMDMAYYPANFPIKKLQGKLAEGEIQVARVIYSRPQKNKRTIFGTLVEYGKVWRLGANEATEIEFYKDVKIAGKKVKKGRYTLYAIPNEKQWEIIINKETDTWGSFAYNDKKDLMRTTITVQKLTEAVEAFTMQFEKTATGFELQIAWDSVKTTLPISL